MKQDFTGKSFYETVEYSTIGIEYEVKNNGNK